MGSNGLGRRGWGAFFSVFGLNIAIAIAFGSGCGPVNNRPAEKAATATGGCNGPAVTDASGAGAEKIFSSQKSGYLVMYRLVGPPGSPSSGKQPVFGAGDNYFSFRILRLSDLSAIPANAAVVATYKRVKSTRDRTFPVQLEHQDGGQYLAKVTVKHSSDIELRLKVSDPAAGPNVNEEDAEHVFMVTGKAD